MFFIVACSEKKIVQSPEETAIDIDNSIATYRNSNDRSNSFTWYGKNVSTHSKLWSHQFNDYFIYETNHLTIDRYIASPLICKDSLYQAYPDGKLVGFSLQTGKVMYSLDTNVPIFSTPTIAYPFLFFGSADKQFYCFNLETKKKMWNFNVNDDIAESSLYKDQTIFFASKSGNVYAMNTINGQLLWTRKIAWNTYYSMSICEDSLFIASSSNEAELYSLDLETGEQQWVYIVPNKEYFISSPIVQSHSIIFCSNNSLFVIQSSDGTLRWKQDRKQYNLTEENVTVSQEKICFADIYSLSIYEIESGKLLDQTFFQDQFSYINHLTSTQEGKYIFFSGSLVSSGLPYPTGVICKFDVETSKIIWKHQFPSAMNVNFYIPLGLYKDYIYCSTAERYPAGFNCNIYVFK